MQTQSETQPTDPVPPAPEPAQAETAKAGEAKAGEAKPVEDPAAEAKPAKAGEKRKRREGPARPKGRRRGPPRPHRKLSDEVLQARVDKLRKRAEKASDQLEEAERHIAGYEMEFKYRALDAEREEGEGKAEAA